MTSSERIERLIELLKKGVRLSGITPHKFYDGKEFYKIEFCAIDPEVRVGLVLQTERQTKFEKQISLDIVEIYEVSRGKSKNKTILLGKTLPKKLVFQYEQTSQIQHLFGILTLS